MDDFELPDDLKDQIEVVYLDDVNLDEVIEYGENEDENAEENIQTEVVDMSNLSFHKHTRSVFCCDLSEDSTLAVTGGEDDVAYVWSVTDGEVLVECTGHKDSVTEVCFNFDGQYVATGDMSGLIQVWYIKEKKLVWCYEGDDLEWLRWHKLINVLMAGMQSGDVFIWQIPQGNCKVLASHGSSTTCSSLLPDGKKIIVGYSDGLVKLWDMKKAMILWQLTGLEEVTNFDISDDGSLLAVAPKSQIIKISDGKIIGQFINNGKGDVEVVLFNNEMGVLITGSLSGQLCVWDISRQILRHQAELNCTVTSLQWGFHEKLLVGATDGSIYVCDVRSGTLIATLTGHHQGILSMSISKNKTFVLTTSDDCTAKIFTLKSD